MDYETCNTIDCEVCGRRFTNRQEWILLPACAAVVCGVGDVLCCYSTVCRKECQFQCLACDEVVTEINVVKTEEGFFCKKCHKKTTLKPIELYPYYGMSIEEYVRHYGMRLTIDEINQYKQRLRQRTFL
jgi:hypothetical protein